MKTAKTAKILNAHAKRRAAERYGISLNKYARREIVRMIQSNKAEFVGRHSNNRSMWRVCYQNEVLNVVYDRQRQAMCTVLPKDAAEFQVTEAQPDPEELKAEKRRAITQELAEFWAE